MDQRNGWIESIREAAAALMAKASQGGASGSADVAAIRNQLEHLNTVWNRVRTLMDQRTERLNAALKLAVQFQKMCRSLMDYFAGAEHVIRRLAALPTYDDDVEDDSDNTDNALDPDRLSDKPKKSKNEAPEDLSSAIESHEQTHTNLMDQAERVEATLQLGTQLLAQAHPEAVPRLRQWIHTVQSRWNDLISWSAQRGDRLRAALSEQDKRRVLHRELTEWIIATRRRLEQEPAITLADPSVSAVSSVPLSVSEEVERPSTEDTHAEFTDNQGPFSSDAPRFEEQPVVTSFRTLLLHEITEPELVERLLEEQAELEQEFATRQPILDAILKHAKLRVIPKSSIPRGPMAARRSRVGSRGLGSGRLSVSRTSQVASTSVNNEISYVSPVINQLYQRWIQLQRLLDARRVKLRDRLSYLSEVEKLKTFDFEAWRQRYVAWLNQNKARVIDLFHRKDLDRDGRLTYAEFIDGILEMKFSTTRVELQAVAEVFDANGDGYIDYRECLNALRAGYVASRVGIGSYPSAVGESSSSMLSLSQLRSTDEEVINDEVRRQVGLCTCHNTYQICKMTTDKYRFGDSQKLRLVRILKSAVMVRVGGGWVNLDEFLAKNDPCRGACQRLSSFTDLAAAAGLTTTNRQRPPIPSHHRGPPSLSTNYSNALRSSIDSHSSSQQTCMAGEKGARRSRQRGRMSYNHAAFRPISGPGQDNAFYLVMPSTKANPSNHLSFYSPHIGEWFTEAKR
ncbi:unnamed protein product [Dicrocoelium dendriticum]|nr:unnamed protein product [Dicrocoelium dendriticum]